MSSKVRKSSSPVGPREGPERVSGGRRSIGSPEIVRTGVHGRSNRAGTAMSNDHLIQLQRLIGNQATRHLVGEPGVQRMVAIAVDDLEKTTDSLVHNNAAYAAEVYGGPLVELRQGGDYRAAGKGSLVIVEHGQPGEIAGHDATWVADQLYGGGMPADVARVILYSCFAASEELAGNTSLVTQLAAELEVHYPGAKIPVWGQTGVGFAFEGIGEQTTQGDFAASAAAWYKTKWDLSRTTKHEALFAAPSQLNASQLAGMAGIPPESQAVAAAIAVLDPTARIVDFKPADLMVKDANDVLDARREPRIQIPQRPDFMERSRIITKLMTPFWEDAKSTKALADVLTTQGWKLEFS